MERRTDEQTCSRVFLSGGDGAAKPLSRFRTVDRCTQRANVKLRAGPERSGSEKNEDGARAISNARRAYNKILNAIAIYVAGRERVTEFKSGFAARQF